MAGNGDAALAGGASEIVHAKLKFSENTNHAVQVNGFDYSVLGTEAATLAKSVAQRIKTDMRQMATTAIERGLDLIRVYDRMGRGHFGRWLESEFGATARTAYNWMQAARVFGENSETVSGLPERII